MEKVMLAKQPILNHKKELFAYELLYRGEEPTDHFDGDFATIDVMVNAFVNIGIEQLSGAYPVFINFTENLLKEGIIQQFDPDNLIIELLETIEITEEIKFFIKKLAKQGYRLALDDVTLELFEKWEQADLIRYLTFIKVDFIQCETRCKRQQIAERVRQNYPRIRLLAEKIETIEVFREALEIGYQYFQGYFFMRPKLMESLEIPSFYYTYLRLIQQIDRKDFDLKEIANIIQMDLSLSYKLLKLINSPAYRRIERIHSIHQAVVLLGQKEIKKWLYILALRENYQRKSFQGTDALVKSSYYRAKMCESIAQRIVPNLKQEAFLVGYFSQLPAILLQPIDKLLRSLSLDEVIEQALLGKQGILTDIYHLAVAYEQVNWLELDRLMEKLRLDQEWVFTTYQDAQTWVQNILRN
ncbi:EAL and HDOD domain-containing protein [Amphibacillus sp. Q70]|uniref:EAL and HDOD domain-containing protein n=1 Tax=Amphibacillus sp. Q70 TaxID=3453416 RepID=UPI003F85C4C7